MGRERSIVPYNACALISKPTKRKERATAYVPTLTFFLFGYSAEKIIKKPVKHALIAVDVYCNLSKKNISSEKNRRAEMATPSISFSLLLIIVK